MGCLYTTVRFLCLLYTTPHLEQENDCWLFLWISFSCLNKLRRCLNTIPHCSHFYKIKIIYTMSKLYRGIKIIILWKFSTQSGNITYMLLWFLWAIHSSVACCRCFYSMLVLVITNLKVLSFYSHQISNDVIAKWGKMGNWREGFQWRLFLFLVKTSDLRIERNFMLILFDGMVFSRFLL